MSLIAVSRYVIRALVMSVSVALLFRICSAVAIALSARPLVDVTWPLSRWSQKGRNFSDLKDGPLSELIL